MATSRKDFLKTLSTGASLSLFPLLNTVDKNFKNDISDFKTSRKLPTHNDYSLSENVVYLNHGSIGTMPKAVQNAHKQYLDACESNPWLHMWGNAWEEPLSEVRVQAAKFINAQIDEISFSHNTTEVYNILALGLPLGPGDEVLFSNMNHAGASIPFQIHSSKRGYKVNVFDMPITDLTDLSEQDILDLYDQNITSKTKLIVLPHIDNTFGIRQPVKEIVKLARSRGVEFISLDTAQTMGMIPIDVKDMDIDVIGTSAHKWIQAPKGVSLAYFSKRVQDMIDPMIVTWGQGRWKNSARKFEDYGTRNLAEVLTLGKAIEFQAAIDKNSSLGKLKSLREYAMKLTSENENTIWRSPNDWDLSGSLFVIELKNKVPTTFAQYAFKNHGIVLRPFDAYSTIRISPNVFNTEDELDSLFSII